MKNTKLYKRFYQLTHGLKNVIVGKSAQIEKAVVCLLAGGHLLLEDMPGVGKTTLASSIAKAIGGSFNRIQFTSDLLPSDILGSRIYRRKLEEFDFLKGPIFANLVLADELNRAPPKTQSALLQAMNDFSVNIERKSFPLMAPFMVIATQNPQGFHGTYPLPESQRDRFLMRVSMGYPDLDSEVEILKKHQLCKPLEVFEEVLELEDILDAQKLVKNIEVPEHVLSYIGRIVSATRAHSEVAMPVSPRGSIALMRAAQALAFLRGLERVDLDLIKELVPPVFCHRLTLKGRHRISSEEGAGEIWIREEILQKIPID